MRFVRTIEEPHCEYECSCGATFEVDPSDYTNTTLAEVDGRLRQVPECPECGATGADDPEDEEQPEEDQ